MVQGLVFVLWLCSLTRKGRVMVWIPVVLEWHEANVRSACKGGISRADCQDAVTKLMQFSQGKIFLDAVGCRKEWYGIKRFVSVSQDVSGRNIFLCFTLKRYDEIAIVRIIDARPVNKNEPILRASVPDRFVRVPSLLKILGL